MFKKKKKKITVLVFPVILDLQFPIDIETVKNDHEFLDRDAMESLFR